MYFKFKNTDIFRNTIVTYPSFNCIFRNYASTVRMIVQINNPQISGTMASVPENGISVLEKNIDRSGNQLIKPFIAKTDSDVWISGLSSGSFQSLFQYGTSLTGSYLIHKTFASDYVTSSNHPVLSSLQNFFNQQRLLNADFDFSNISVPCSYHLIPRELYGSAIKKGSVKAGIVLQDSPSQQVGYTIAEDINKDGILKVTHDSNSGSFSTVGQKVGYVLYELGIVLFHSASIFLQNNSTGAQIVPTYYDPLKWSSGSDSTANWKYFGDNNACVVDSFSNYCFLNFQGTQKIQNITMMCTAPVGKLNNSINPTFLERSQNIYLTQSSNSTFVENKDLRITNIVSSSFQINEEFSKETYISEVYIYDEEKKLIGIAKLANPVRKREFVPYTFKLSYDL